jgi:deoxyribodipyrimidine photolyase-related protein
LPTLADMTQSAPRLLFADQLGPHFDDGVPVMMTEVLRPFRARRYHRQKAHLILSALRHKALELGDRVDYRKGETYTELLGGVDFSVVNPSSRRLRSLVKNLQTQATIEVLPARGFVTSEEDFGAWAATQKSGRLLMDNFYRARRNALGILMTGPTGSEPQGGRFNFDHSNREPPPKGQDTLGIVEPWYPTEDDVDDEVRDYLDFLEASGEVSFMGQDGPRLFPVTRGEALAALEHFVAHRLPHFGPHEDAAMTGDWAMSHSLLSPSMNLGLLDPREVINRALEAGEQGGIELASLEGFVRQIMGWRDWVWHLYWHLGEDFERANVLDHHRALPDFFHTLDAEAVTSVCLSHVLAEVNQRGWTHHINRLMVLGSWALQRGVNPQELNDWFIDAFVDGTPWVMPANVVGMSQWADGGVVATKPYTSGGSYLKKMTNYCSSCAFRPTERLGDKACPMTAGYWTFLHDHQELLATNHRMAKPLGGMRRLADIQQVVAQERLRTEW